MADSGGRCGVLSHHASTYAAGGSWVLVDTPKGPTDPCSMLGRIRAARPSRRSTSSPRSPNLRRSGAARLCALDPLRSEPYKTAASARTPARGSNQYAAHHVAQGCQAAQRHLYRPCLWLTLPLSGCVDDFHLQAGAPCRAHHKKAPPGRGFGSTGQARIRSGNRRQGAGHPNPRPLLGR